MYDNLKEKNNIALTSVIAAIFLTSFKLIIGLMTGSLGILSEALHSGLDMFAAIITMFAVRFADKPADEFHHYGHGKIENYSALVETALLMITCFWIIYEAIQRLIFKTVHIEVNIWSFIVIITSIVIDISRSRALYKVARKYNSQALEADALHFSTDIFSSIVVLIGLVGVYFNVHDADPIAALLVSIIVLGIGFRLGKKSFDVLIDKAPKGLYEEIISIVQAVPEVKSFHDIRIREAGPNKFIDLNIHVDSKITIEEAHKISHQVEDRIMAQIKNVKVMVHIEPDND